MGFLRRFKDIASGRVSKINHLFGNHAIRICEKLDNDTNENLRCIVIETSKCTIMLSEALLYDVENFRHDDGTIEFNPFKENMNRLNTTNAIVMFKLIAGNYLVRLIVGGYLERVQELVPQIKSQFFEIYEFTDDEIKIFNELEKLAETDERPLPELRLYDYILEKAYNIKAPELPYQMLNFENIFLAMFNEIFLPNLLSSLEQDF